MTSAKYLYDTDDPLVYRNEMGRYKTRKQLDFIQRFLNTSESMILDIGGGAGRLAIPLMSLGHRVTVLDPSHQGLELLSGRVGTRIETIEGDLLSVPQGRSFDVAIAIDSIKYMVSAPLVTLFSRVNSLLLHNGVFIVAEINQQSWRNHLSQLSGRRQEKYNISSAQGYRSALECAGFEILNITGFLWMPFRFNSNSRLVEVFARVERVLHLDCCIDQSPWLLIAAKKVKDFPKP